MKTLIVLLLLLTVSSCEFYFMTFDECPEVITDISIDQRCEPRDMQVVNSYGGSIDAALMIAAFTKDTHVDRYCFSACVMIASSGDYRTACSDAVYGVHQGTVDVGTKRMKRFYSDDDRVESEYINYLIDITPADDIYKITAYMAMQYGLVDELLECE